jgi:ABC-2 family transporter
MTGAARLARAEAHKLRRPLTMSVFLTVIGFLLANVSIAEMNGQQAMGQLRAMEEARACATAQERASRACRSGERGRRMGEALSPVTAHAEQDVATAALLQSPSGGLLLAADMWATLVGGFAIALLASGHVAGEWSGRTIGAVLVVYRPRRVFLLAKLVSVWLSGVGMLILTAALFAALSPILRSTFSLGQVPVAVDPEPVGTVLALGRAAVVLGAYAALGCLCAMVTRSPLGTFIMMAGILLAAMGLATFPGTDTFSPADWVSGWMALHSGGQVPYLWTDRSTIGMPTSLAGIVLGTSAVLLWSLRQLTRMDVTT